MTNKFIQPADGIEVVSHAIDRVMARLDADPTGLVRRDALQLLEEGYTEEAVLSLRCTEAVMSALGIALGIRHSVEARK